MSSTSMSLETLQFLLQHMDANRRFEISNRCPALRAIDKSVPLKIKSLVFRESCVIVNDTKYKIGVIRNYNVGETPDYVKEINKRGGVPQEVDRYGVFDKMDALAVTPGDVELQSGRGREHEAMKQLATVLFGDRASPIYVTKLDVRISVVRLPVGVKFHIQQLMFYGCVEKTLEALAPVIHESSYPFKKLDISYLLVKETTNPHVRAAGTLSIIVIFPNILQLITAITNPVVSIILMTLSEQTLEGIIGNWIILKRPIGTEHTFLIQLEPHFVDEMEDILKRLNGVPVDDGNVIIPMSDDTQLKISYGPFPEFAPRCSWAVKFLTEAIDH
ncbi:unnamed protein product [Caenorhabditis brenneri]